MSLRTAKPDGNQAGPAPPPIILKTRDVDEAAAVLSTSAVPYRSELLGPSTSFSTEISGGPAWRSQLSYVKTVGAMHVKAELPHDSYAMVLGTAGELEHRVDGEVVCVSRNCALIQSPSQPVEVRTPESFELLFLRFDRESFVAELEKLLLRKVHAPLVFSPGFSTRTVAGKRVREMVATLQALLRQCITFDQRRYAASLETELIGLLLETQRHNYTRLLARRQGAGSWQVRIAEEFISSNAHLPLSLGDISLAAGVNARTLQHAFQSKRGYSPLQFMRRVRLQKVRAELSQASDACTVTSVAWRWGFLHFGRFAREYQMRFGEKPSETLRRSRPPA